MKRQSAQPLELDAWVRDVHEFSGAGGGWWAPSLGSACLALACLALAGASSGRHFSCHAALVGFFSGFPPRLARKPATRRRASSAQMPVARLPARSKRCMCPPC